MKLDVIALAREAGLEQCDCEPKCHLFLGGSSNLKALVALVVEKCIEIVEPSEDHRRNPRDYIAEEEGVELLDNVVEKLRSLIGKE